MEGVNINEIIAKISTGDLNKMVNVLANGIFAIDGKFSVKVKNYVVITVLT